ncbi:hypothetical protein JXJ21_08490 [candidate division KSB1 bacterium]|nr:hypothetical protein [candidate division KSB1 bacterium]
MLKTIAIATIIFSTFSHTITFAKGTTMPIQLSSDEQLFLDDTLIERAENITRRVNPAQKLGAPILRADRPWEGGLALLFGTAMFDSSDALYKMWYYCDGGHVAYAVSKDGLHWEKPELGVISRDGQPTNLVIERSSFGHFYELFGVLKDEAEPDAARRYKMAFVSIQREYSGEHEGTHHRTQRRGLGVAASPDGIHWTLENDFASDDICDISRFFRDERQQRYVLYGRTKLMPENNDGRWRLWGWGRAVTRLESRDFLNWSTGELVYAAEAFDPEGTEIYSMSVFPYAGGYVGLVQLFYGLPTQGNLDFQLSFSRDGRQFTRVLPREPFIPEGKIGDWDRFNISLGNMPPVVVGDEFWFYYSGRTYRHGPYKGKDSGEKTGAIGLAKIKRGRFLSLEASFDSGRVVTKPLLLSGSKLLVNANTAFGTLQVEVLDQTGNTLPGWRTRIQKSDGVDIPVIFDGGSLEQFAGQPVRLRFTLINAQLYGFRVQP